MPSSCQDIERPTAADLHRRLGGAVAWNVLAMVLLQGGTFLGNIVLARLLGKGPFGEFAILQNTQSAWSSIAQLAAWLTASKYIAELRHTDPARAGRVAAWCAGMSTVGGAIACLALLAGADVLAARAFRLPHLAGAVRWTAPAVLFAAAAGFQMGALAGLERYRRLALGSGAGAACYLIACVAGARWWGVAGAAGAMSARFLCQWAVQEVLLRGAMVREGIAIRWRGAWEEQRIVWRFALPAMLMSGSTFAAGWLAATLLVRSPGGESRLAVYTAANNFRMIVLFAPFVMNAVAWPLLNNRLGLGDGAGGRRVYVLNTAASVGMVVLAGGAIALGGPWLLRVFGRSFTEGDAALRVLMLACLPEVLAVTTNQLLYARERIWISLAAVALPRDALLVALAWRLAPSMGAAGLAWAYAAAWTLAFGLNMILLRARLGTAGVAPTGLDGAAAAVLSAGDAPAGLAAAAIETMAEDAPDGRDRAR